MSRVDNILKVFNKTISKLGKVVSDNDLEIERNENIIAEVSQDTADRANESKRAAHAILKLEDIVYV